MTFALGRGPLGQNRAVASARPLPSTLDTSGLASARRLLAGSWGFVAVTFAVSRLFFLVVGAVAARTLDEAIPAADVLEPGGALHYWATWDGAWYAGIAEHGYGEFEPEKSPAFFPLYPVLVRVGTWVGAGPAAWGVAVSTVASLAALYFVYRIAEERWGRSTARASTLALAFFPTAFFLNAVYTEALFLAVAAGSLWALVVRRDLLLAGVLAALATATRNVGVFLLIPIAYDVINRRDRTWRSAAAVALVPAGLVAYIVYLWARFGDPLRFSSAQREGWGRRFTSPVSTLERAWEEAGSGLTYLTHPNRVFETESPWPAFDLARTTSLGFLALAVGLIVAAFLLLPRAEALFAALLVVVPLLYASPTQPALMSLSRFMLVAFPLFFVAGLVLARTRVGLAAWLAASALAGGYFAALFTTWRWVA